MFFSPFAGSIHLTSDILRKNTIESGTNTCTPIWENCSLGCAYQPRSYIIWNFSLIGFQPHSPLLLEQLYLMHSFPPATCLWGEGRGVLRVRVIHVSTLLAHSIGKDDCCSNERSCCESQSLVKNCTEWKYSYCIYSIKWICRRIWLLYTCIYWGGKNDIVFFNREVS